MFQNVLCECPLNVPTKSSTNVRYKCSLNVLMEGSRNLLFEYSLNIAAERSLDISFERSWNVPQEHSENIALERSKNPDSFVVLGTFLERSDGTFRTFHGNVHRTFREGIVLWGYRSTTTILAWFGSVWLLAIPQTQKTTPRTPFWHDWRDTSRI